jgi:hypothetical protein
VAGVTTIAVIGRIMAHWVLDWLERHHREDPSGEFEPAR